MSLICPVTFFLTLDRTSVAMESETPPRIEVKEEEGAAPGHKPAIDDGAASLACGTIS